MLLKNHVRKAIKYYPLLYKTEDTELSKWLVYNQLFCTIGNGMEWKNGEMVPFDGYPPFREHMMEKVKYSYECSLRDIESDIRAGMADAFIVLRVKRMIEKMGGIQGGEEQSGETFLSRFYPLSHASGLMTVPKDIRADWLQGVLDMCAKIEDFYYTVQIENKKPKISHEPEYATATQKEVDNQLYWVGKCRERLQSMKLI